MKKLLIALCLFVGVVGAVQADECTKALSGGSLVSTDVRNICDAFGEGSLILDNATYLSALDESGNTHDILGVDSAGNTELVAASGEVLEFKVGAGNIFQANGSHVQFADGTASLPGLSFISDPNTGIYRISADTLGVAVGGSFVHQTTSAGLSVAGQFRNITSGGALVLRSADGSYSVCTVNNSDVFSCAAE